MSTPIVMEALELSAPPQVRTPLSFSLREGDRLCLYGLGGAGKTTLIQALLGQRRHLGEVRWYVARSTCGYAAQRPRMIPCSTVLQHLVWCACLHGHAVSVRSGRIYELLERFGLSPKRQYSITHLSPGEQAKLELCSALLVASRLIVVDGVLDLIDEKACEQFWEEVDARCARREMALLYATHSARQAEMASRVIILHQGRLLADETPERLLAMTPPRRITLSELPAEEEADVLTIRVVPTLADALQHLVSTERGEC